MRAHRAERRLAPAADGYCPVIAPLHGLGMAALVTAGALLGAACPPALAGPAGSEAELLARHRPLYVYDRRERDFAVSVAAARHWSPGQRPPRLGGSRRPTVYGHVAREPSGELWLQYWTFHLDNPQDRGIVRTGRHRGDWELVALRLDSPRRPQLAAYAQHSWIEACPWSRVSRTGGGEVPIVHVAHGSHAALFAPGYADRPWPDPNDEADGAGRRLRPAVAVIRDRSPSWVGWPGRWGGTEAGWVPGEHPSPQGPAFKIPWSNPAEVLTRARDCGSGPPPRPLQTAGLGLAVVAACGGVGLAWRRRRGGAPARRRCP